MVSISKINKGEILIRDNPVILLANELYSDIFQFIDQILESHNITIKFMKLYPKSLKEYQMNEKIKNNIIEELNSLKKYDINMYRRFIQNYDINQILLFCAKYMCNAFEIKGRPAFLFTGTLLNHSCVPNVIFGEIGDQIVFMAVRDINKGEQIYDNYVDITLNTERRKKELLVRYGFECCCESCMGRVDNNIVVEIERERIEKFGIRKR